MDQETKRGGDLNATGRKLARGELTHPEVKPLDVSGIPTVTVLTTAWAVAGVVLLLLRDRLRTEHAEWWLWVPPTGFVLGLIGLLYCKRRWAAIRHHHVAQSGSNSSSDNVSK